MQSSEFQSVYRAEPFRPFVVNLADGRNIRVEHSEFMAVSPTGRSAVIYGDDGSFEIIDVMLVTSITVGNGKAKGRAKKRR
ncbi:MAG: hypothetical protein IIC02_06145 [Planctomycetes bacterium]|nr:hypothetical protein [Planctomycetota bacterium]